MDLNIKINIVVLCIVNVVFTFFGIFLNSLVIISFWTSSQLRKKTCYFMVLVLACFDVVTAGVSHPSLVLCSLMWLGRGSNIPRFMAFVHLSLYANSFIALLGMNLERYLALTFPYFHARSVTKQRILAILFTTQLLYLTLLICLYFFKQIESELMLLWLVLLLALVLCTNVKLLKIAKRLKRNEIVPAGVCNNRMLKNKTFSMHIRSTSTCTLAAVCLFLCCFPTIIFMGFSMASLLSLNDEKGVLFYVWETSIVATSSTFNCLIFFWKNSTLRSEGKRVLKSFLCAFLVNPH